ncbi:hypothetical protein TIFTF001_004966 [Ficus carica]|uniref:Uncharacterized protein n=1 Tax=Ficus carica TaxID=3494 RepID=A0AA87ZJ77_FICCA|nr:hypothetical protein TIFTF001_004966 [Ficus carica]
MTGDHGLSKAKLWGKYPRTYSNRMTFATVKASNNFALVILREQDTHLQSISLKNALPCLKDGSTMNLCK